MLRPWNLNLKIEEKYFQLPIYKQIVETIIDAIHSGKLRQGNVLPGTRKLADMLKVNRNTVIEAYTQLEYEGWVISKPRTGTFVSSHTPENRKVTPSPDFGRMRASVNKIVFDQGLPDISFSPMADIMREYKLVMKSIRKHKIHIFNDPAGYIKLRMALSQMLNHQRRIIGDENNICITRDGQMAFFLISQCLLESGDCVIVEHPGYRSAWDTFEHAGATVLYASIDTEGIIIDEVQKFINAGKKIKAVFITPNSQFPTTAVLSESRRRALTDLSNKFNFYVIEYDYCIDINYSENRLLPLCSDERLKNYIYIGSFSASVSPFLNIGYVVGDQEMIKKINALKNIIDVNGDPIMERAFFNLIDDGTYTKHLKKSVPFYKCKRDFFEELLNKYLKDKITFIKPELGLSYWITLVEPLRESYNSYLKEEIIAKGIKPVLMGSDYYNFDEGEGFLVSFGSVSEKNMEEAVRIMSGFF